MRKLILTFVMFLILSSMLTFSASAGENTNQSKSCLIDNGNIFTPDEEVRINAAITKAEEQTKIIFVIASYNLSSVIPEGKDVVAKQGLDTNSDDIVLLIIESGSRNYYEMFTWGIANTVITDSAVEKILDSKDVYNSIKGGNFGSGALSFVEETVDAIESYRRGLVVGLIVFSLLAGAIAVISVIVVYKRKLKSPIYPLSQFTKLDLTEHADIFLGKTVTRTKTSSSSSGGSSGRSSGGSRGRR